MSSKNNPYFEIPDFPVQGDYFASPWESWSTLYNADDDGSGPGQTDLTRLSDEYSTAFGNACAGGQQFKKVFIINERLKDDDSGSLQFRMISTLSDAMIAGYRVDGGSRGHVSYLEHITFSYGKMSTSFQRS